LVELAAAVLANKHQKAEETILAINKKHATLAKQLDSPKSCLNYQQELLRSLRDICQSSTVSGNLALTDEIYSFGERLSANLIAPLIKSSELVDARDLIKTDDHFGNATPEIKQIGSQARKIVLPLIAKGKVVITQGFIGSSPDNMTTTLGRGGSDYTASLLAEALGANQMQIWTDTAGIASADPRIISSAQQIEQLSFQEAAELATAGAKILFPKTILPARRSKIPVFVGSTFHPQDGGTLITSETAHKPLIKAIALKTNQSLVSISTPEMAHQPGYLAKIFTIFAEHKISIDQVSTSEITVSIIVEDKISSHGKLIDSLRELGEVKVEKGLSVISLIGNQVNNAPGLTRDIFHTIEAEGDKIAIRMICQGASRHNFCFVVADKYGVSIVEQLHKEFIDL